QREVANGRDFAGSFRPTDGIRRPSIAGRPRARASPRRMDALSGRPEPPGESGLFEATRRQHTGRRHLPVTNPFFSVVCYPLTAHVVNRIHAHTHAFHPLPTKGDSPPYTQTPYPRLSVSMRAAPRGPNISTLPGTWSHPCPNDPSGEKVSCVFDQPISNLSRSLPRSFHLSWL